LKLKLKNEGTVLVLVTRPRLMNVEMMKRLSILLQCQQPGQ